MTQSSRVGCDSRRLASYLAGRLESQEEASLIRHLDACRECREQLEALAGGPQWWSDAERFLGDAPSADGTPGSIPANSPTKEPSDSPANPWESISLDFLAPSEQPGMLGRIGLYEVAGVVGRGGTGIVLKAFDPMLHRNVAIKVLAPPWTGSGAARQRFNREALAAAAVVHEHIVPIHAIDEFRGLPYLVMQYVPGQSLQQRIERQGALDLQPIIRIGMQVAAGLAAAHAHGLVHRDIKPANILLEHGIDRVLITDFGLARAADDASITQSGFLAGTPQYMAPEQARGEAVDPRSDLFSLGSVLYAMCTGHAPFRAETTLAILRRIVEDRPRSVRESRPEIPEWLDRIVAKLHAKRPEDRFQSAGEVAELLGGHLAHLQQPSLVPLPAPVRLPADRVKGKRGRLRLVGTVGVLLLALGAVRDRGIPAAPAIPGNSNGP